MTLTSPIHASIDRLLLAAPNTYGMNGVSASRVITPYPEMTSDQIATQGYVQQGWRAEQPSSPLIDALPKLSPFPTDVTLYRSTASWDVPCGRACPGVRRQTLGLRGIGYWRWRAVPAGDDAVLTHMRYSATEWRTGDECHNPHCTSSEGYMAGATDPGVLEEDG